MKRAGTWEEGQHALAPTVKLNVGGVLFDTTRSTLAQCQYFEPVLERRLRHGTVDDQGRWFIDRDGKLFAHLLNYMRTRQRPTQKVVQEMRDQLLAECDFFGLDSLAKNLRGEVSLHDMRWQERALREDEAQLRGDPTILKQGYLIDLFRAAIS